jgi:hypothetical protein
MQYDFPDNVILIDPQKIFCDDNVCYAVKNGTPLYFDNNHMSLVGAGLVASDILEK